MFGNRKATLDQMLCPGTVARGAPKIGVSHLRENIEHSTAQAPLKPSTSRFAAWETDMSGSRSILIHGKHLRAKSSQGIEIHKRSPNNDFASICRISATRSGLNCGSISTVKTLQPRSRAGRDAPPRPEHRSHQTSCGLRSASRCPCLGRCCSPSAHRPSRCRTSAPATVPSPLSTALRQSPPRAPEAASS